MNHFYKIFGFCRSTFNAVNVCFIGKDVQKRITRLSSLQFLLPSSRKLKDLMKIKHYYYFLAPLFLKIRVLLNLTDVYIKEQ
jgi:hypothetical protein